MCLAYSQKVAGTSCSDLDFDYYWMLLVSTALSNNEGVSMAFGDEGMLRMALLALNVRLRTIF